MRTRLLLAATLAFAGTNALHAAPAPAEAGKPIDVVICLDTSNSMDGLIESAKLKLWTIVNDLAKVKPAPVLRVGLYSYGNDNYDRNTGWVRKELDLTVDLDEVYKKLNALKTRGGTEYVARVTRDALEQLKWTEDKDALRLIFVCGNEPATQDPQVRLETVAEMAKKKGVFVNTIYCGRADHPEASGWRDFATMAGGKYANINQDQARTQVVATPYDKDLIALGGKLNSTYFAYTRDGKEKQLNQLVQDKNAATAAPAVAAERTATKASGLYRNSTWDIVDRMKADPKFDIKKIKDEDLCDELRKMKPEEREAFVKKKAAERADIQKKINDLNAQRSKYIQDELKKKPNPADRAFDDAIKATIRAQAAAKGLTIPE